MDWIRKMNLKQALFTMTLIGLLFATSLSMIVFYSCVHLKNKLAPSGTVVEFTRFNPPIITHLPDPSIRLKRIAIMIEFLQFILPILIFVSIILMTTTLFYKIKLQEPLKILKYSTEQIIANNLDFSIKRTKNKDELSELCIVFEIMRQSLWITNQTLWRESEERKRLNAIFAHDLRNPITVLKGTVQLLKRDEAMERNISEIERKSQVAQALKRLENYIARIECYIEAMSHIQKLEQMPLKMDYISTDEIEKEIKNTIELIDSTISYEINGTSQRTIFLDYNLFMIVTENLINNAVRFAKDKVYIDIQIKGDLLSLIVRDNGKGYPIELIKNGPKPFKQLKETAHHFGIGLYSSQLLCQKHGGQLKLENRQNQGAKAIASLQIDKKY